MGWAPLSICPGQDPGEETGGWRQEGWRVQPLHPAPQLWLSLVQPCWEYHVLQLKDRDLQEGWSQGGRIDFLVPTVDLRGILGHGGWARSIYLSIV